MNTYRILLLFLCASLGGCAATSPAERMQHAGTLARQHGWERLLLPSGAFTLVAYVPGEKMLMEHLTVYFEGDGRAWVNSSLPSSDPTPVDPVALELALRHPDDGVAYLARPCQYVRASDPACRPAYWTSRRFSPEVVEASDIAVETLKKRFGARRLTLVGYSGGGAVAALVAARRDDVVRLVTVAGNLDHKAWTSEHRISPLAGSLNPADEWLRLKNIEQVHYVGGSDSNVGRHVAESYASRFPAAQRPEIAIVPGFDHHCCWVDKWEELLLQSR